MLLLRTGAGGEPASTLGHDGFRDEKGNRRPVDQAFLRWRLRNAGSQRQFAEREGDNTADVRLWDALAAGTGEMPELSGEGPLIDRRACRSIEVWTETELCALHALAWHGLVGPQGGRLDQALRAAAWHIEHTQADNATQRPWAIHVFAMLAAKDGNADAGVFAETLLHACQVSLGAADMLSRHILADAADWIEAVSGEAE